MRYSSCSYQSSLHHCTYRDAQQTVEMLDIPTPQLHALQQKLLERGSNGIRGVKSSSFAELLARLSTQSVHDEVQALITATETFRGQPHLT